MSHHHHYGHHHHGHPSNCDECRHAMCRHKRQQNLAWFGIVMIAAIFALLGIAMLSGSHHGKTLPPLSPVSAPPIEVSPPVVTPPVPPVSVEPPDVLPLDIAPPPVENHSSVRHQPHHRHHRWHHDRRGHVSRRGGNNSGYGACGVIPGYAGDGSVISIPNPDCN